MRFNKAEVAGVKKGSFYNVKPFVVIIQLYNGVTHPSIKCVEEATWEGLDCNSPKDRPHSSFLQALLWSNDELSNMSKKCQIYIN